MVRGECNHNSGLVDIGTSLRGYQNSGLTLAWLDLMTRQSAGTLSPACTIQAETLDAQSRLAAYPVSSLCSDAEVRQNGRGGGGMV